jgi:NADH-quinone oxidoreductase subunit G
LDIKLTIDGKEVVVPQGTMLIDACRQAGADIPTFCFDPDLKLAGSCRMCVVQPKGWRNLVASCVTPHLPGRLVF